MIRYLHLSDLHLTASENKGIEDEDPKMEFNPHVVMRTMLEMIRDSGLQFDFVIITGDIAQSGQPAQYNVCVNFCTQLLEAVNLERNRLFLVPGNHDVDRGQVTNRHVKRLYPFEDQEEITEILTDPDDFSVIMRKFEAFNRFAEAAMDCRRFDQETFSYTERLDIEKSGRSCRVNLVGLNSCLFAGYDGDEKEKLALGLYQVEKALENLKKGDLSICFFHHPFKCFHPKDKVCRNALTRHFDLILTGHVHDPENAFTRNEAGQALIIGAGAAYESRENRNSFNIVEIDPATGKGRVQFFKYLPDHNLWKADPDVNPYMEDGSFAFQLERDPKPSIQDEEERPGEGEAEGVNHRLEIEGSALRKAYLNRLLYDAGLLALEGIDPKSASCETDATLNLGAVYTALLTQGSADRMEGMGPMESGERSGMPALEVLDRHRHLVLLGDPGSGKTTFVNFVTWCMAGALYHHPEANVDLLTRPLPDEKGEDGEEPQKWTHGPLLPIRVVLRDFAARGLPAEDASAAGLWRFIGSELERADLKEFAPFLRREFLEKGGLLLLDGLDEVPETENLRVRIKEMVEDFIKTFHRCRVIVTSRTYAYQRQDWRIPALRETVLAPFSDGQIRRFVDRWYAHTAQIRHAGSEDVLGRAELLKRAIFTNPRLKELAGRPLLLTLMASLHAWRGGSLPEKREELYADTVDLLLDRWEKPKVSRNPDGTCALAQPSLMEWLKVDRTGIRQMLHELAYTVHAGQPDLVGTADIPVRDLAAGLMSLTDDPDLKQQQLIGYLRDRAGLIIPRGVGIYTFPHRTFQEYLAACHLTDTDYPDTVVRLVRNDPNRWREVCQLAGAKAARGSASSIWGLVDALCFREVDEDGAEPADLWGALMAGCALSELAMLKNISEANRKKLDRVVRWLLHIITRNQLPALERVAAGNALSVLGDPRFDPDHWYLPKEEMFGFVKIPAGPFRMGTTEADAERLKEMYGDAEFNGHKVYDLIVPHEMPQHSLDLPEFYIAKYPVTKAQYRTFVQNSGYETDGRWEYYGQENHPVVTISWYDADTYCKWLTEKFKDCVWQFMLPTEAQWEKAARGIGVKLFPCGDSPDPDKANYYDTGIFGTSPVGCFPEGNTSFRLSDMIGNTWEWTRSLWGSDKKQSYFKYPYISHDGREDMSSVIVYRIVRGGSWFNHPIRCRTSHRGWYYPCSRGNLGGFRLVLCQKRQVHTDK